MLRKLGRLPRTFNPAVPHMSALLNTRAGLPASIPLTLDNTFGMSENLGMMLNDSLGCCTCAAFYHARQVWSMRGRNWEATASDHLVELLYEQACGYNPNDSSTDQGGVEQDVLTHLVNAGAPVAWGTDKLKAFFEIDTRNHDDARRAIWECGIVYMGIQVPNGPITSGDPPYLWDLTPAAGIEGGHAVVAAGYTTTGPLIISWGKRYQMTWAFWDMYCQEAYALVDAAWFAISGKSFLGLSESDLETQMAAIKKK